MPTLPRNAGPLSSTERPDRWGYVALGEVPSYPTCARTGVPHLFRKCRAPPHLSSARQAPTPLPAIPEMADSLPPTRPELPETPHGRWVGEGATHFGLGVPEPPES
jgi:hypothetical protein